MKNLRLTKNLRKKEELKEVAELCYLERMKCLMLLEMLEDFEKGVHE